MKKVFLILFISPIIGFGQNIKPEIVIKSIIVILTSFFRLRFLVSLMSIYKIFQSTNQIGSSK